MTRILSLLALLVLVVPAAKAQEKCITEILFQEQAASNPQLILDRENFEKDLLRIMAQQQPEHRGASVVYKIPVVYHVIHFGGPENISKAQIESNMLVLNRDYRRLNPDTVNTDPAFQGIAADAEIEFELAKLDPNGNCTDGIVRVYNSMTYNARNGNLSASVKGLSCWPRNQYLNAWVVNSIKNTGTINGIVLGYAQFPGGADSTDGVVLRYENVGIVGNTVSNPKARTSTHEVGHWLALYHIWGDDGGACSGTDYVNDTPNQADMTFSTCPSYPLYDACTGSGAGVNFQNYMDYTDEACQNMFTDGQKTRMVNALTSTVSGRNNLVTPQNHAATGIDGNSSGICAPKADFIPRPRFVCEGNTVTFEDESWNGTVTSRLWTFPGGSPATDTSANPVVLYSTPGTYDVTLSVSNGLGTDTKTVQGMVIVSPSAITQSVPYFEGFESGTFPFADYTLINSNNSGPASAPYRTETWQRTTVASASGTGSLRLRNYTGTNQLGNERGYDEFITPAFNLGNVTNTSLSFSLAYAPSRRLPVSLDKLTVYYSTNCGRTWTPRYTKSGNTLATVTDSSANDWKPTTANQWRTETINLASTSISTQPNVRFRFEFLHDTGNNIFIDDLSLNGTVTALDEINAQNAAVTVYPNPSSSDTYVDFSLVVAGKVTINITDVSGRSISTFSDELPAGDHQYTIPEGLVQGVYLVQFSFGEYSTVKRVVIR